MIRALNLLQKIGLVVSAALVSLAAQTASADEVNIYEAFNEPFRVVQERLPEIAALGFTHVLISPPQKSLDRSEWWARYQPVDYRLIEGPLGRQEDLVSLTQQAHQLKIKIVVDTVLNHMADVRSYPDLQYPQFGAGDFHGRDSSSCIRNFGDRRQAVEGWLCDFRAMLPDLKTESQYVRQVHLEYLRKLVELGADGFRFDAAVNIEPDYFAFLKKNLGDKLFYFGEVVGTSKEEVRLYTRDMKVTDFWLLRSMLKMFDGDAPVSEFESALSGTAGLGSDQVAFVRTHDALFHQDFFNLSDPKAIELAYAFVLTSQFPNTFVLDRDLALPSVRPALEFRRAVSGASHRFVKGKELCAWEKCSANRVLAWTREQKGFVVMNTASQWATLGNLEALQVPSGCYRELLYKFEACFASVDGKTVLTSWAGGTTASVGPRTALFFVK